MLVRVRGEHHHRRRRWRRIIGMGRIVLWVVVQHVRFEVEDLRADLQSILEFERDVRQKTKDVRHMMIVEMDRRRDALVTFVP